MPALQVDPTRVIQMVVNLLSNASKYSPVGSLIDLAVRLEGSQLRISVADRGRGIAPEKHGTIFMPFVRLDPQFDQGSGLGLSVVKAIAEAHQGQVGVEARNGGGSIFWVTLPTMEAEDEGAGG
ncbi:MAG: ATP-binding protein [Anaerolineae bacterium]